jgi:hypothetical protein
MRYGPAGANVIEETEARFHAVSASSSPMSTMAFSFLVFLTALGFGLTTKARWSNSRFQ